MHSRYKDLWAPYIIKVRLSGDVWLRRWYRAAVDQARTKGIKVGTAVSRFSSAIMLALTQCLTLAPYLFIYPKASYHWKRLSSDASFSQRSQGTAGTQLARVYSQLDVKRVSPLTLMAAAAPKLCISQETRTYAHAKLCAHLTHSRGTCRLLGIKQPQKIAGSNHSIVF